MKCYWAEMDDSEFEKVERAWARLIRASMRNLNAIEADLKKAGMPPLSWYDVLLELKRQPSGSLRPREIEGHLLLEQHNVSRLIDRLEKKGLVKRQPVEDDGRGQAIAITKAGRELQQKMWPVYRAAIKRHVGAKLSSEEADMLAELLKKLVSDN
jgi:DNA-binding MarR family transcriptional regulator